MFSIFGYLKNHPLHVLIFIYSFGKSKPEIITTINIDKLFEKMFKATKNDIQRVGEYSV